VQTDIDPRDLIGHKAVDRNGDKIGTVDEVYLDDATGEPEWAAVRTGIFGRDAFVPLTTSEFSGEELRVPYDKSLIKESPDFGVGQHLSPAQELQLYRYYGLDTSGHGRPTAPPAAAAPAGTGRAQDADFGAVSGRAADGGRDGGHARADGGAVHDRAGGEQRPTAGPAAAPQAEAVRATGRPADGTASHGAAADPRPAAQTLVDNVRHLPTAAPAPVTRSSPAATRPAPTGTGTAPAAARTAAPATAPSGPVEVTCREERLDISTEWHVLGTARLRKYVTTEAVERRVPVVRERVRVERVPVTDAERASLTEQEIADAVEEVTLREERPVVRKYLAPVERVRLVVERYTEEEVVREELRREQVEVHDGTAQQPHGPQQTDRAAAPQGRPAAADAGHGQAAAPHAGPTPAHAAGPLPAGVAARTASPNGTVRPESLRPS
jgi:stress response protein YsnF/sporulation protein YlmC with PRC-barrel domain